MFITLTIIRGISGMTTSYPFVILATLKLIRIEISGNYSLLIK